MRYSKPAVALLLIVAVVMGFTGCNKAFSRDAFISEVESYGIEKTDDSGSVLNNMIGRGGHDGYCIFDDKDEARKMCNLVFSRFNTMPEIEASGFALASVREKGSDGKSYSSSVCCITFADGQKAKNAYNTLADKYGDREDGKTGKRAGVTYCVVSHKSDSRTIGIGVYLQGDTVIFVNTQASVNDGYIFADKICNKLGLLSPSKAG